MRNLPRQQVTGGSMKSALVAAVLVFFSHLQASSTRPNVTISPHYKQISVGGEVIVTCNANEPLVGCEFDRDDYDLIDLSQGARSRPPRDNSYFGTGLQHGDCGVKMSNFLDGGSRVDCRVRSEKGGWVYGDMKVFQQKGDTKELHFETFPTQTHAMPGDTVRILHRLIEPTKSNLSECQFNFHNRTVTLNDATRTREYAYYGSGMTSGECGIQIFNISEEFVSGIFERSRLVARLVTADPGEVQPAAWLLIAEPPKTTLLAVDTSSRYSEGDTLFASCTSLSSKPVPNITWYLDDVIIKNDRDDDSPIIKTWSFPNLLQNITQILNWKLKAEDDGKKVVCRIQHFAIPHPGFIDETSAALSVNKSVPTSKILPTPTIGSRAGEDGLRTADVFPTCWMIIITLGSLLAIAVCAFVIIGCAWYTRKCCFRPPPSESEACVSYRQSIDDTMYDDIMNLSIKRS